MWQRLTDAARALHGVAASAEIRRAEGAWMLGWTAEWSWLIALFVFAYSAGGVALVGALGLTRTLPAAILAPALSALADRVPRHRVLLGIHGGRSILVALAAVVALAGWPPVLVLGIAACDGLLAVLHRPSHMAMMPSLARSPEELVSANVASSTLEAVGTLVGPIVGGLVVATGHPGLSFALPAATFGLAAVTVLGIRPARAASRPAVQSGPGDVLLGGLRALRAQPHAGFLLGLFGLQTLVRGLLGVLLVVLAIELLTLGDEGVGFLNAAIGAGGFVGALTAMALVGRARLSGPVFLGLLLWGLPILLIGLAPQVGLAFAALALLGAGNAVLDVAGFTLLQRIVPNAARGRVFGLLEAIVMLTVGAGAALAPLVIGLLGARGALMATGLILPIAACIAWPWLRGADQQAVIPERELALLRGVPMLSPLPMTVLEEVAAQLVPLRYPAGSRIVTEGEVGERFFIIASGEVEVTAAGHVHHRLGAGDSFGEIALLRAVPRTATVTAIGEIEAMALDRDAFLAAVTGDRLSLQAAEQVVDQRLGHSH